MESYPRGTFTVSRRSDFIVVGAHCAFGTIARLNSLSSRASPRPFVPCRSRNRVLSPLAAATGSRLSCALAIGGCDRYVRLSCALALGGCDRYVCSTLGTQISPCLDRLRSFLVHCADSIVRIQTLVDPVQLKKVLTNDCNKVTCMNDRCLHAPPHR